MLNNSIQPEEKQEQIPSFWTLNIVTKTVDNAHLFMFACVAMTEREAYEKAVANMRNVAPELYNLGIQGRGFEIVSVQKCTFSQIKESFEVYMRKLPGIHFVVVESPPQDESQSEKDIMIKRIIETRDLALLEENRENFTEHEIAYIHDIIK